MHVPLKIVPWSFQGKYPEINYLYDKLLFWKSDYCSYSLYFLFFLGLTSILYKVVEKSSHIGTHRYFTAHVCQRSRSLTHTHTYKQTHTYTYTCVCMYVCLCVRAWVPQRWHMRAIKYMFKFQLCGC